MAMGSDAAEAALGLLGLTGGIDFRSSPTIPLKRKSSTTFSLPTDDHHHDAATSSTANETISCICGFTYDDGFSIACDDCSRWVHAACFDIVEGGQVPEEWRCWVCQPRKVDGERAARIQRSRQKQLQAAAGAEGDRHKRRVSSPGVDRKRRASAAAIDGSGNATKRKRRYSVNVAGQQQYSGQHDRPPLTPQQQHFQQPSIPGYEDEHVEIDEPATHSYVHVDQDIVPHQYTRDKLKRLARHWRGMTALDSPTDDPTVPVVLTPDAFPSTPQTSLHPLPKSSFSHPTLSSHTNPSVRPPSYTVRTTQPIPSSALIAPYTSTIIPSTVYLSDPLNSYAHLGMPKPFVHLMGPPLDLALDARLAGNGSRFVRNGCRPNAVLRPILCKEAKAADLRGPAIPEDTLTFGVFALRDLKAHEEVVLGWEWDDGSVIHQLPALINTPHAFAPHRVELFRYQMTSMLHAISSTFTTCACGAKTRDCALNRLADFVDGQPPLTPAPSPPSHHAEEGCRREDGQTTKADMGPLIGVERGFRTKERVPFSGGMSGVEMVSSSSGWRWRSASSSEQSPVAGPSKLPVVHGGSLQKTEGIKTRDRKGKARASEDEMEVDVSTPASEGGETTERKTRPIRRNGGTKKVTVQQSSSSSPQSQPLPIPQIPPQNEALLPPKLRKKWIHQHTPIQPEKLPEHSTNSSPPLHSPVPMEVEPADDAKIMPPPPLPPHDSHQHRPSSDPTSPSVPFANLSLTSPLVSGPDSTANYFELARQTASLEARTSSPTPLRSRTWDETVLGLSIHRRTDEALQPKSSPSPSPSPPQPTSEPSASADPPRCASPVPDAEESLPLPMPSIQFESPSPVAEKSHEDHLPPDDTHGDTATDDRPSDMPAQESPSASTETSPAIDSAPPPPDIPPPPTKVKLSLRDFAMRKKKQREEESKASPVVNAAPLTDVEHVQSETNSVEPQAEAKEDPTRASTDEVTEVHTEPMELEPQAPELPAAAPENSVVDATPTTEGMDVEMSAEKTCSTSPSAKASELLDTRMDVDKPVTLEAKVELVEPSRISESPPFREYSSTHDYSPQSPTPSRTPPSESEPMATTSQTKKENTEPRRSPNPSALLHAHQPLARQISQEDGEIFSPPPPKPLPLAPRAHSPPTQPRSFNLHSGTTSPTRPPPSGPPRRPLQPSPYRAQLQNAPLNGRPPSGPRALRGVGGGGRADYYPPFRPGDAPRAPSADRDRDHRVDWDRDRRHGSWRGRGGGWGSGR